MTDLMPGDLTYDFIVVGAGVEGSATALSIVEKTLNSSVHVAILEQVRSYAHDVTIMYI